MITGQLTPAQYAKQLAIKAVTLPEDSGVFALKNAQLLQYQQDTEGGGVASERNSTHKSNI